MSKFLSTNRDNGKNKSDLQETQAETDKGDT